MPEKRQHLSCRARKAISYRIRGHNQKDSLKLAGYGEAQYAHCADVFWKRPAVKAELKKRQRDVARKANVEAADLIKMLMNIAGLDPADLVDEDSGEALPVHLIPEHVRKSLNLSTFDRGMKLSNADRLKAIELIAKLSGLMEDSVKLTADKELTDALMAGRQRAKIRNQE